MTKYNEWLVGKLMEVAKAEGKDYERHNAVQKIVHAEKDGEGLQTMRTLARNAAFLIKSIAAGKEKFGLPEKEEKIVTSFIK